MLAGARYSRVVRWLRAVVVTGAIAFGLTSCTLQEDLRVHPLAKDAVLLRHFISDCGFDHSITSKGLILFACNEGGKKYFSIVSSRDWGEQYRIDAKEAYGNIDPMLMDYAGRLSIVTYGRPTLGQWHRPQALYYYDVESGRASDVPILTQEDERLDSLYIDVVNDCALFLVGKLGSEPLSMGPYDLVVVEGEYLRSSRPNIDLRPGNPNVRRLRSNDPGPKTLFSGRTRARCVRDPASNELRLFSVTAAGISGAEMGLPWTRLFLSDPWSASMPPAETEGVLLMQSPDGTKEIIELLPSTMPGVVTALTSSGVVEVFNVSGERIDRPAAGEDEEWRSYDPSLRKGVVMVRHERPVQGLGLTNEIRIRDCADDGCRSRSLGILDAGPRLSANPYGSSHGGMVHTFIVDAIALPDGTYAVGPNRKSELLVAEFPGGDDAGR